jgi:hypothetical protein
VARRNPTLESQPKESPIAAVEVETAALTAILYDEWKKSKALLRTFPLS